MIGLILKVKWGLQNWLNEEDTWKMMESEVKSKWLSGLTALKRKAFLSTKMEVDPFIKDKIILLTQLTSTILTQLLSLANKIPTKKFWRNSMLILMNLKKSLKISNKKLKTFVKKIRNSMKMEIKNSPQSKAC